MKSGCASWQVLSLFLLLPCIRSEIDMGLKNRTRVYRDFNAIYQEKFAQIDTLNVSLLQLF